MQQYQVPQFITIEDKVIGPFTVKQFLYLAGGAGLSFLVYKFFKPFVSFPFGVIVLSFSASLAFLKINEQPFPRVVKNAFFFMIRPRLYIWKKEATRPAPAKKENSATAPAGVKGIPKISASKLSDLAWSLDIKSKEELRI